MTTHLEWNRSKINVPALQNTFLLHQEMPFLYRFSIFFLVGEGVNEFPSLAPQKSAAGSASVSTYNFTWLSLLKVPKSYVK